MAAKGASPGGTPKEFAGAPEATELVFALCHELGNLMGAVRLYAHLIDDEMGAKELARTSIDLDDLSARSAALLSLVRPLLSGRPRSLETLPVARLIQTVQGLMAGHGGRGTRLDFEAPEDSSMVHADATTLQRLIENFLYAALDSTSGAGLVSVRAVVMGDEVAVELEDDGPESEDPAGFREQMQRGRPLLCSVADRLLQAQGGRLEAERDSGRTRIRLVLAAV